MSEAINSRDRSYDKKNRRIPVLGNVFPNKELNSVAHVSSNISS